MKNEAEIREIVQYIFDEGMQYGDECHTYITISEDVRIQHCIKKLKEWLE